MKHFGGKFNHQVDDRFRLRIPAKLRDNLTSGAIMHGGMHGQLIIIPKETYEDIIGKSYGDISLDEFNQDPKRVRQYRSFVAHSMECVEDSHGRIMLSAEIVKFAKIKKNLVTIGRFNTIEIWAEEVYNRYMDEDN